MLSSPLSESSVRAGGKDVPACDLVFLFFRVVLSIVPSWCLLLMALKIVNFVSVQISAAHKRFVCQ